MEHAAVLIHFPGAGRHHRAWHQLPLESGGASAGFGIPITDPAAFPFMWVKCIRDIFLGVVVLALLFRGERRAIAIVYAIAVFIAVGDGFVILKHLGLAPPIFMHWGTATYMAVVALFLHRKKS